MDYIAQPKDYWIALQAIKITLNALGNPNRMQGSVASGAAILCYIEGVDGLGYDNGHRFRTWPLAISPTYFNSNTEKYVYVAIPRSEAVGTQAIVVFPSEQLDIYGKNVGNAQIGSTDYYYIWLQGIITATDGTSNREWQQAIDFGKKGTDEDLYDETTSEWYVYSKVSEVVTFLKNITMKTGTTFHNLILGYKELTGVATADTSDEFVDSETLVVTPSYLKKNTEDKFLRKDQDDETPYSLTVGGNLSVGGVLRAVTGYITSLYSNLVQSTNYTGDGIADTGYRLTADDGTGSSALTVDNLHVRKKATFEELEVKKETSVAGNEVRSAAANVINRTDYIDQNGKVIGYSYHTVPWMLRKMPFLLRHRFFGRLRRVRITIDPEHVGDIKKIRCYFLAKDGDRDVKNLWRAHDLVRCQTFNISRSNRFTYIGTASQSKFGNVYWWRKVVLVSTSPVAIDDKEYHYFDVSMDDCDAGSDIPCAGDHAVQFGNDSDSERMNLIIQEVNGTDAPAIKAYTGIYTYDLNKCWWGGTTRKMMLSPKEGYEFYGPSFKFVQEYGQAPASIDRGTWVDIPTDRDDYEPHAQVRKCYYNDKVSHNGCYWRCVMSQVGAHWVDASGNYLTQAQYDALPADQKLLCTRRQNYVSSQPGTDDTAWEKLVDKGDAAPYYVEDYGISASRTSHSDVTSWSSAEPVPTAQKPYVWMRTRLYNPNTQQYRAATYVCLTGERGVNGKDGWMITANPANVIITQSLNNNTSSFSSATVSFSAKKGSASATITSVGTPASSEFNVSKSGNTVVVSSPKKHGNPAEYYSEGSFTVTINVTDPDTGSTVSFSVTVLCYANLLGTWKESVEAGTKTEVARSLTYGYNPEAGEVIPIENFGSFIKSSEENISTISRQINDPTTGLVTQISTIDQKADRISLSVESKENTNLVPDPDIYQMLTTSIERTVALVKDRKYTLTARLKNNSTSSRTCGIEVLTVTTLGCVLNAGETKNFSKTFTAPADGDFTIRVPQTASVQLQWLQLEQGEAFSQHNTISSAFKRTGIDIENGTINLQADKVAFYDSSGSVSPYIELTSDGKIKATEVDLSGKISATSGEIGGFIIGEHLIKSNNNKIILNDDGTGIIGGFSIGEKELKNTAYDASVVIQNSQTYPTQIVKIGKSAVDAYTGSSYKCSLQAEAKGTGTYNTALYLNAQNGTYNYAFHGNGNGVLNGFMAGFRPQIITIPSGSGDVSSSRILIREGSLVVIKGSHTSGHVMVGMPTLTEIRRTLGIDSSIPFFFELNVISYSTYEFVRLSFRGDTGQSGSEYPVLMGYDDTPLFEGLSTRTSYQIAQGDYFKILLTYIKNTSGTLEYRAYVLQNLN